MVSDAWLEPICLILRFDWARMSLLPSLTLSLFPFRQVRHLGQAHSLARYSSAIENGHVCCPVVLVSSGRHGRFFFKTLTCWRQLFAHGGLPSLEAAIKTCRSLQAFYELSINTHLVSSDYVLFYFVIALLNSYSHNLLLLSFFCHLDAISHAIPCLFPFCMMLSSAV